MKFQPILLTCALSLFAFPAFAQSETVTATVKHIESYGESGDAFTFKAVSGSVGGK